MSSAKDALFPAASIGEIKARSPAKSYIPNQANDHSKSAIMPPTNKYGRSRVISSNSFDNAANNRNQEPVIKHQYSNSNDASNKLPIREGYEPKPNEYNNMGSPKKSWPDSGIIKGHARSGSADVKSALMPPGNMRRETNSASTLPLNNNRNSFHPALRDAHTPQPVRDHPSNRG